MDRGEGGRGGTLIRDGELFPGRVFPRKQKPLLGTLIRDEQRFPGRVFSRKQKPLLPPSRKKSGGRPDGWKTPDAKESPRRKESWSNHRLCVKRQLVE